MQLRFISSLLSWDCDLVESSDLSVRVTAASGRREGDICVMRGLWRRLEASTAIRVCRYAEDDAELRIRPYWRWFSFIADSIVRSDWRRTSIETTTYWCSFLSPDNCR